jgi:hypothetical protein
MQHIILAVLIATSAPIPVVAADPGQPAAAVFSAAKTGKERLSDKASDEQRVDDCKVPQDRRTRARPASCPWDVGS